MADNPAFQHDESGVVRDENNLTTTPAHNPPTPDLHKDKHSSNGGRIENVELDKVTVGARRRHVGGDTDLQLPDETTGGKGKACDLLYKVDEAPVWYMTLLFGFQHYILMVSSSISVPFILFPLLCVDENDTARGRLVCTLIFTSGIITLLQTTVGVRLPIVQGGTFSFLVPTIAYINTAFPKCEDLPLANMTVAQREEEWQVRMRAIQGAVIMASIVQMLLGFTGLIGVLLSVISPLTIVPTLVLIGLTLFETATDTASLHWGISGLTIGLITLFSQFLQEVPIPLPSYTRKKGFKIIWFYIFKLFSILLGMLLAWFVCLILTLTDVLPKDNPARTDYSTDFISLSPWFVFPYPGQWGMPTFDLAAALGMMAGMFASVVESIGDYYACARIAGASKPPAHAMNRGVGIEGVGGILSGLLGTGNASTSYSTNVGAIGITKVGSNRVVQAAGLLMVVFGIMGKIGAVFVSIPSPIIGGMFCILFGMIVSVGLSSLQYVDLNSSRNLYILGVSVFMGLALPKWMMKNPGVINTGVLLLDQILTVLLQTSMLIGGLIGGFLDNLVPGTPEERGLLQWNDKGSSLEKTEDGKPSSYDLPFGMDAIRRASWTKYIPFCPTFMGCRRK